MSQLAYHRYTITVPDNMAEQIEAVCAKEGRNRSELFREAFRMYLSGGTGAVTRPAANMASAERKEDPFHPFWPERSPKPSQAYERLAIESEKDRLLEQWAQMVETAPGFEDVRAVSGAVDAVAGEPIA